jgi:Tol biopolymer transport system component
MLCWRANRPQGPQLTDYRNLLSMGLVEPVGMQLFVMNIDDPLSATMIGPFNGTSFAPSFLPDDSGLIFSSNMHDPQRGSFQIYTVNLDGTNLKQITTEAEWGR